MVEDVVYVKLRISIPKRKWLAQITNNYPNLIFKILSNYLLDRNTGILLLQIEGLDVKNFNFNSQHDRLTLSQQILFSGNDFIIINVKENDPWVLNTLIKTELLFTYPIIVKDSKLNVDIIAERKKIDYFLNELEKRGIQVEIRSIGYYQKKVILTNKQREILKKAYNFGYFEIPRKISLTNFAKKLQISPSALSETIRRINQKLTQNFLDNL
ncbi:MAG: helix-turn-helix domain-containing protein [Promethearchaeota archaeon]|jgi:predicted DNA binding protein